MRNYKITCAIFLVAISFTATHVFADDDQPPLGNLADKDTRDKCFTKTGITKDQLKDSLSDISSGSDPAAGKDAYCYIKCLVEETGLLNANKEIDMSKLKDMVSGQLTGPALDEFLTCVQKAGKISTCDDVKQLYKCKPKMDN